MTGYTYRLVQENQTFKSFAMTCARAFIPFMREAPLEAPIPESIPMDAYYSKSYEEAKKELAKIRKLTREQQIQYGRRGLRKLIAYNKKRSAAEADERKILNDMREMVSKWNPPSPNHVRLKTFMLEQIGDPQIDEDYYLGQIADYLAYDPLTYYKEALDSAKQRVQRRAEDLKQHKRNIKELNLWLKQLRKSLREKQ